MCSSLIGFLGVLAAGVSSMAKQKNTLGMLILHN